MFEITLSGPGKNALGTAMMTFLIDQLREAAGRPVLLTGAGDAFSAGLNLKEVTSLDRAALLDFLRLLERCMTALYLYPGPTVAAVNGHAIAGGCVLTLCCDRRVLAKNPRLKIGLNEVALGVRFPPRVFAIVKGRVPKQHIEQVVLGAGLCGPDEALRLGLVDELADDPVAVARERLAALAANPAAAYALVKQDLRGTEDDLCPGEVWEKKLEETAAPWVGPAFQQATAKVLGR